MWYNTKLLFCKRNLYTDCICIPWLYGFRYALLIKLISITKVVNRFKSQGHCLWKNYRPITPLITIIHIHYTCMYYIKFTSKLELTHLLKSRLLQLALLSLALRHRKHISPQHCYKNISERNVQRLFSRRFNTQHVIQYAGFFAHACTYKFMRKWTAFLFFKEISNY